MNVWLAPSAYHPVLGGIEHLTRSLALQLGRRGHSVTVVTARWPAELPALERVDGIDVHRLHMPAPSSRPGALARYPAAARRTARALASLLRESRPAVVHAVGASWQAHHVIAAARRAGIPALLNLQGETAMDDHGIYQRSLLLRSALRAMVRRAAVVTACSHWALRHAATIAPAAADGRVIPNGVWVEELAGTGPAPASGPILAYGRLVPNKGFDLLLDAVATLPGTRVEIGGDGPSAAELRRRAASLDGRARLLGRLDRTQVAAALAACRVVAVPSRLEPFGIVALEAMAAGRPVVASSAGGTGEFLVGGILADPTDRDGLAAALRRALESPELGERGRLAARDYDWSTVGERWAALYREVAG